MQKLEGMILGHYSIQKQKDLGGMAEIYLAVDNRTGQTVAMKLVHSSDEEYFERFLREIKAMAALRHEHILPVLDYGRSGFWCYMVAPYIEYGTLGRRLRNGPLSLQDAGDILAQLASALQFAHSRGVIHRDIKPANVLLKDGKHVYLADFGLAKSAQDRHSLTKTGFIMGTAEYVAPEAADKSATPASDIYSLGVLLYQMLTGRTPFQAVSAVDVFYQHLFDEPPPPSQFNPALPKNIEAVILRALAKEPQERFSSPVEFAQAYQHALIQANVAEPPKSVERASFAGSHNASFTQPIFSHLQQHRKIIARSSLIAACVAIPLLFLLVWGTSAFGAYGQSTHSGGHFSTVPKQMKLSVTPSPSTQNMPINTDDPASSQTSDGQYVPAQPTATSGSNITPTNTPVTQPSSPDTTEKGNGHGHGHSKLLAWWWWLWY